MSEDGKIYIGTILLEKQRWAKDKTPTYRVSEWAERFAEAGFDGMELWEYHATLCSPEEVAALETSPCPIAIFNSYASMDDAGQADREKAAELTRRFGARRVKFNVGKDPSARTAYLRNLRAWRAQFPDDVRLLCECHPGTIIEEPAEARKFFDEVGGDTWQVIVHAFSRPERLKDWFGHLGPAVMHAHLQMRDEGESVRFERKPERAREAIHIMREEGYAGSFTLEFTQGTRTPGENIDDLWENAVADLRFLRELVS